MNLMKRIKPILLSLLMLLMLMATPCSADAALSGSPAVKKTVTYFDDGSRLTTTTMETPLSQNPFGAQTYATSKTVKNWKLSEYFNASGELMWYFKVTGIYTYDGSTAKCNSSDITAHSYNSTWKLSKLSSATNGATAIAHITAKQYMAGVVMKTMNESLTLTCRPNGTFY